MGFQEKILGQVRPTDATNTTLYTLSALTTVIITTIHVCNTSSSDVTFRIFADAIGSTYDETTAIYYDVELTSNETIKIQTHIGLDTAGGTIGVRTNNGNTLTFTANGVEITQ